MADGGMVDLTDSPPAPSSPPGSVDLTALDDDAEPATRPEARRSIRPSGGAVTKCQSAPPTAGGGGGWGGGCSRSSAGAGGQEERESREKVARNAGERAAVEAGALFIMFYY